MDGDEAFMARVWSDKTTEAEARTIAAMFPKSAKIEAYGVTDGTRIVYWVVGIRGWISLRTDKVNKGVNETGIKRLQTIKRICAKNHIKFAYQRNAGNSIPLEFLQ